MTIMLMLCFLVAPGAAGAPVSYSLDLTWKPQFPVGAHTLSAVGIYNPRHNPLHGNPTGPIVYVTQRGNTSIPPVLVMNGTDGSLILTWGQDGVGIDRSNQSSPTWGAHGISIEECKYPCVSTAGPQFAYMRVFVEDFVNHTITAFTGVGQRVLRMGSPGVAGNGTDPLQFGRVADAVIETGASPQSSSHLFVSDGDGGTANRVLKVVLESDRPTDETYRVKWATPAMFNNPHSIALHARSGLLIVADRENNATRLLSAESGQDLGVWNCGLNFGAQGKPFGVRTWAKNGQDLVVVASMDNPQDHRFQRIYILDASGLNARDGAKSSCRVLQTLEIDPARYSGPHLIDVDTVSGDVYAALVADSPMSTVLRFRCTGCKGSPNDRSEAASMFV